MVAGTIVFSMGCGLLEVLLSPIINSIPSTEKSLSMAFLHAFYPIGKVAVIVVTGLALYGFSLEAWPWIMPGWAVLLLVNMLAYFPG